MTMAVKPPRAAMSARMERIQKWYDENASRFADSSTVEVVFLGLDEAQQERLNRFKLWALERGGSVSLEGKRVLEFGCGHGRMALEMPGYAEYVGVDFSAELVRMGEERLARAGLSDRARLVASDCLSFEGPAEHYDVVGSLGMFPYVDDPEGVLRKMASHLRPGGTLFVDGYLSSPVYDPIRRLRWLIRKPTGGTNRLYTERAMRDMFARAGLADMRFIVREYPFLSSLYARRGWQWPLALRNGLARHRWLNVFATDFFAIGSKPARPALGHA
jgi:ubiquinone/menaquinone biosynthesis C-methylase UbiE